MEKGSLVCESWSLLDQVDGWVCVWEGMAAGCTMGRSQADEGNVMLCWSVDCKYKLS